MIPQEYQVESVTHWGYDNPSFLPSLKSDKCQTDTELGFDYTFPVESGYKIVSPALAPFLSSETQIPRFVV
jgi:hypothetical protein